MIAQEGRRLITLSKLVHFLVRGDGNGTVELMSRYSLEVIDQSLQGTRGQRGDHRVP